MRIFLCKRIFLDPASIIWSICSFSRTVSLSITISFLSIDITSPVSSSTKSSIQLFKTRAANFLPSIFFRPVLVTFISSARSKISKISRSCSNPIALKRVVTGNFFLRSMYAYITLLMSVANSIHDPLKGITRAEYSFVPLA